MSGTLQTQDTAAIQEAAASETDAAEAIDKIGDSLPRLQSRSVPLPSFRALPTGGPDGAHHQLRTSASARRSDDGGPPLQIALPSQLEPVLSGGSGGTAAWLQRGSFVVRVSRLASSARGSMSFRRAAAAAAAVSPISEEGGLGRTSMPVFGAPAVGWGQGQVEARECHQGPAQSSLDLAPAGSAVGMPAYVVAAGDGAQGRAKPSSIDLDSAGPHQQLTQRQLQQQPQPASRVGSLQVELSLPPTEAAATASAKAGSSLQKAVASLRRIFSHDRGIGQGLLTDVEQQGHASPRSPRSAGSSSGSRRPTEGPAEGAAGLGESKARRPAGSRVRVSGSGEGGSDLGGETTDREESRHTAGPDHQLSRHTGTFTPAAIAAGQLVHQLDRSRSLEVDFKVTEFVFRLEQKALRCVAVGRWRGGGVHVVVQWCRELARAAGELLGDKAAAMRRRRPHKGDSQEVEAAVQMWAVLQMWAVQMWAGGICSLAAPVWAMFCM